jgi:hypothetical protein
LNLRSRWTLAISPGNYTNFIRPVLNTSALSTEHTKYCIGPARCGRCLKLKTQRNALRVKLLTKLSVNIPLTECLHIGFSTPMTYPRL